MTDIVKIELLSDSTVVQTASSRFGGGGLVGITIYSVGFDLSFSKPTVEYPPEYIDEDLYFQLSTSAAGDGQPEYVPSKAPLLDENGIKAYYLGSSYNDFPRERQPRIQFDFFANEILNAISLLD